MTGVATDKDAAELVHFVKDLREDALNWLKQHHPELKRPAESTARLWVEVKQSVTAKVLIGLTAPPCSCCG
jgi:hypothetical protein